MASRYVHHFQSSRAHRSVLRAGSTVNVLEEEEPTRSSLAYACGTAMQSHLHMSDWTDKLRSLYSVTSSRRVWLKHEARNCGKQPAEAKRKTVAQRCNDGVCASEGTKPTAPDRKSPLPLLVGCIYGAASGLDGKKSCGGVSVNFLGENVHRDRSWFLVPELCL
jgi:hypothetical protein